MKKMFQQRFNIFGETLFEKIGHSFSTLRKDTFTIHRSFSWRLKKMFQQRSGPITLNDQRVLSASFL
jgi:hypothetical protein